MPQIISLAVVVGVLAVVATWLFGLAPLGAANFQVWAAFIAWGCFFHCGGKGRGLMLAVVCMSWGALVGMVSTFLALNLGALGPLGAPVAVGVGAAVIVLSSKLDFLSQIPASVYGFASIFAVILLKTGFTYEGAEMAFLPIVGSVVIGALFGFVSEILTGMLTKKSA